MTDLFESLDSPHTPSIPVSLSLIPVRGHHDATPLHRSPIPGDVDLTPYYVGARLLGLRSLPPQGIELASLLLATEPDSDAPLYGEVVIEWARRATKTTNIWAVLLGLCATRPDYRVVTTAQTGVKARERFLEVWRAVSKRNVGDFRGLRGAGAEAIEWRNGSRLWVVPPEGGAFRGDGADRILCDEAQEHNPEASADILGGALALMDTRFDGEIAPGDDDKPEGQLIVTGTAGKHRSGMLWDYLERGRSGRIGISEYAVPEGVPVALEPDDEQGDPSWRISTKHGKRLNEAAIRAAHPGVGTMTSMRVIRDRWDSLPLLQFLREYGGQWPSDLASRAISPDDWQACAVDEDVPMPERFALAYDIAPDQSSAAIVAGWRDDEGRPWGVVLHHGAQDAWLAKSLFDLARANPRVQIGYDTVHAANVAVADRLNREMRPRPRLVPLGTRDVTAAAAQLAQDIRQKRARMRTDPSMDDAAESANQRSIGDASWAWGRRRSSGDISPLVAWTNAVRTFDMDTRATGPTRIYTRRTA